MKWFKRLAVAFGVVAALWVAAWVAVPPLVRWQAPPRLSELLGRPVTLGDVSFHPWQLEITLHDLAIAAAPGPGAAASGTAPLLHIARIRANVSLSSIVRRAPVIEALDIDAPQINVARLSAGHYDIDDLIRRFSPRADAKPANPARFALYNLQVRDATLRFDDRPAGRVQVVDALRLSLPFVSNLPAQVDVTVQPRLSFRLNGAPFDSAAQATPFATLDRARLKLAVTDLDVRPWLGYLPESLPVRVTGGVVSADLSLVFTQPAKGAPGVALKGWVAARDLVLNDAAGAPLLAWRQMRIGLTDVQPLARQLAFDTLRIEGAQLHLARDAAGRVDPLHATAALAVVAPASAQAAGTAAAGEPAPPPWRVSLDAIDIVDSRLLWNDASVKPAAALAFDGLTLGARQLRWPATSAIPFTLAASIGRQGDAAIPATPARLSLQGTASPQEAQVALALSDLALATLAPYVGQFVLPHVDGRLSAQASLDWSADAAAPRLKVAVANASLDALRVQPGARRGAPAARFEQLTLTDLQLDVPARTVAIAGVRVVRPMLQLARAANGDFDAARWLRAAPAASAGSAARAATGTPWHIQVRNAAIDEGQLQFADATLHAERALPPWRAELRHVRLAVQDFAWFGDRPTPAAQVQLSARVGRPAPAGAPVTRGGELAWTGKLGTSPVMASGNLRIVRFPVALVTPYIADRLPVSLLRAEAGWAGRVTVRALPAGLSVTAAGDALLGDVHLTTPPAAATPVTAAAAPGELLSWQSLSLKGVRFAMTPKTTPRLDIAQVELDDLYSRLVVTEQGRLNLQDIGASPPAGPASGAVASAQVARPGVAVASEPESAASAPLPIVVNVGGIRLVNGRIDYTDHFVRPNYSAALTELNGSLGAFSSASRDMATLQLHGRAEGTAILDISGQVNPLVKPLALDIEAKATDLELAPLSPYAGKYAGYAIERGKLSMDVAYKIAADGKLEARNQLILNQLTFGDAIASPNATKLPVRLAVALLKDRHGVININLPISGSVNDPKFSIGGIILRLILNLLLKAVTSPFALLSGGGSGPDLSAIEFKPGTAVATASGSGAIDQVARALLDRPALQMTITGTADPDAERAAYQSAVIDSQLLTLARNESLRSGAPAPAPASVPAALAPAQRASLLKALYKQTRMRDKPRNVLGMIKDIPDAEMEALLRRNVPVDTEAMRQQALARAIAVRDALIAKGISSDRLFLAAPKLHGPDDTEAAWTPRASLALATR